MYTQAGHLFFQTGPDLNINFKTDGDGKVNLNDNDITNIMDMVSLIQTHFDYIFVLI